jgi:hypothetical protein
VERGVSAYYSKIVFKVLFVYCGRWKANAILWDDSEGSDEGPTSSGNVEV